MDWFDCFSGPALEHAFQTAQLKTHNVIGTSLLVTTASLIFITFSSNITFAIIYSVIFGINNAFNLALFGYIWPRYFGRDILAKYLGEICWQIVLWPTHNAFWAPFLFSRSTF